VDPCYVKVKGDGGNNNMARVTNSIISTPHRISAFRTEFLLSLPSAIF
jgi:hypothetical protein